MSVRRAGSGSSLIRPVPPRNRGFWALSFALGFASIMLAACGGSKGSSGGSPEGVASRALHAMIDGNEQGFLQEVRPDRRESSESRSKRLKDLKGCQIDDSKTVVEGMEVEARVSFVFQESCGGGQFVLYANKGCSVSVEKLTAGGDARWLLTYFDIDCAADLDMRDRFP